MDTSAYIAPSQLQRNLIALGVLLNNNWRASRQPSTVDITERGVSIRFPKGRGLVAKFNITWRELQDHDVETIRQIIVTRAKSLGVSVWEVED